MIGFRRSSRAIAPLPMSAEIESLTSDLNARRTGRGVSPMLVALVALGLLLALYAHWRFGQVDGRVDRLRGQVVELRSEQDRLANQVAALTTRLESTRDAWRSDLAGLREMPGQVAELGQNVAELQARTQSPQRAWVRAEALYLLQLAERRLDLEGDVTTAIVAMESADARLATVNDPAVAEVRRKLAEEIAALRTVHVPDLGDVLTRLGRVEDSAPGLPVLGASATKGRREEASVPDSALERVLRRISEATSDLLSLRRVDPSTARLVTQQEESLRRQHLGLLLFAARVAAMQPDGAAYLKSLRAADAWLAQYFDGSAADVAAARAEVAALAAIDIEPQRPPVGEAGRLLARVMRSGPATP
jgi:uncharacterized protein HemX